MKWDDVVRVVLDQGSEPFFSGGGEAAVGKEGNGEWFVGFWWSEITEAEC